MSSGLIMEKLAKFLPRALLQPCTTVAPSNRACNQTPTLTLGVN
jgi:hypothetical protein